jgi:crotonobetainyl-CoA:carnitine CoA-transferase CaiB-like acyl-CoA transferase
MAAEVALAELRVLEVCNSASRAWCGKLLADLGATVVKIGKVDNSPRTFYLNTGKYVVDVDPNSAEGLRNVQELLPEVDVLVEDLDAEGRAAILGSPPSSLIWCSITPFGLTGPYASFKGQHLNIFHAGGEGYITPNGDGSMLFPDREPLQFGGDIGDFDTGANAAIAILAAWRETQQSGRGHRIDAAAQEAHLTLYRTHLSRYNHSRVVSKRMPPAFDIGGMIRCSDGWVQMAAWQDEVWRGLAKIPDSKFADERFATNQSRAANAKLVREALSEWCGKRTRHQVIKIFGPTGVPIGPYSTAEDVVASPQLAHRSFFQTVECPEKGSVVLPGVPYQFSATPVQLRSMAKIDGSAAAKARLGHSVPRASSLQKRRQPLEGIRILDFSWAVAGPYATLLLGFLGAEIIKIESAKRPDTARRGFLTDYGGINNSPDFNEVNLNKRSLQVDLTKPEGLALVKRLVPLCDMVVDNFRPGVMQRFGLGAKSLLEKYPRLIVASSSSNGSTGPESMTAGLAGIFSAGGGLSAQVGYPDGPPSEIGVSMDYRSANAFAIALLAALIYRDRTGQGQSIDLSSTEVAVAAAPNPVLAHLFGLPVPGRLGNRHAQHAPHNVYRAAGELTWISIAVTTDEEWRALCALIGNPELATRYPNALARKANEDLIDGEIEQWTLRLEAQAAFLLLQEHGIPSAPCYSNKDLASDPHLAARGVFTDVEHPVIGTHRVMRAPWHFADGTMCAIRRHGPLIGQDNDYILRELLGLSASECAALKEVLC